MSIFYVDDDSDDAEIFIDALDEIDSSIKCTIFSDGVKLIDAIASECPHYIFLDYRMPRIDGKQLLDKILNGECFKNTRVVMYSSYMREKEIDECRKLGVFDCLEKSPDFDQLKNDLRKVLSIMD